MNKRRYCAVCGLIAVMLSGCRDISTPEKIKAYTAETVRADTPVSLIQGAGVTEPEMSYDTSETGDIAYIDEGTLSEQTDTETFPDTSPDITSVSFVTTPETTTAASPQPEFTLYAPSTTFPIQTTAPETLLLDPLTPDMTTSTSLSTAAPETAAPVPVAADAAAPKSYNVIGQNNVLVTYRDGHYRGLIGVFGTYSLCESWAGNVSEFARLLPDVKVYNMTIPTSSEFYTPDSFIDSGFTTRQINKIDHIRESLTGVTDIDAYTALASHTAEPIYSRTDHHWQPLGAYYAARTYAQLAGMTFPPLEDYTAVQRAGYVGSMYTYSKDAHLYSDAEVFTLYISPNADALTTTYYDANYSNGYSADLFRTRNASQFYTSFLGTDDCIAKIETDVHNGRTLVIFKDSFGNALVPFLTSGYETIYVCDIRYFRLNAVQFCKDVGADDLLFAVCTSTAAGGNGNYLSEIMKN